MRKRRKEAWLKTNEVDELIDALEHAVLLARMLAGGSSGWKWLILALHNALQGAFTCALRGKDTAGITMLTDASAKADWHWLDVESRKKPHAPMPKEKLASMMQLYKRVSDPGYLDEPCRLSTHPQLDADVHKLNSLRNRFVHFVPGGFSLEVSGMPRITRHSCDAIEHLAVKYPTFAHHLEGRRRNRIKRALSNLRGAMDSWETESIK